MDHSLINSDLMRIFTLCRNIYTLSLTFSKLPVGVTHRQANAPIAWLADWLAIGECDFPYEY